MRDRARIEELLRAYKGAQALRHTSYGSHPWELRHESYGRLSVPFEFEHPQLGKTRTTQLFFRLKRDALAGRDKAIAMLEGWLTELPEE